jgi:hypothetical protein
MSGIVVIWNLDSQAPAEPSGTLYLSGKQVCVGLLFVVVCSKHLYQSIIALDLTVIPQLDIARPRFPSNRSTLVRDLATDFWKISHFWFVAILRRACLQRV